MENWNAGMLAFRVLSHAKYCQLRVSGGEWQTAVMFAHVEPSAVSTLLATALSTERLAAWRTRAFDSLRFAVTAVIEMSISILFHDPFLRQVLFQN
jgi:hypothetical protein